MWIQFMCPAGHRMRQPGQAAGHELHCPKCGLPTIVPEREADPPGPRRRRDSGGAWAQPPVIRRKTSGSAGAAAAPATGAVADASRDAGGRSPSAHLSLLRLDAGSQPIEIRARAALAGGRKLALAALAVSVAAPLVALAALPWFAPRLPPWGPLLMAATVLAATYAMWMAVYPVDIASRIAAAASLAAAFLAAIAGGVGLLAPSRQPEWLGLAEIRPLGSLWCLFGAAGWLAAAWICARAARRWQDRVGSASNVAPRAAAQPTRLWRSAPRSLAADPHADGGTASTLRAAVARSAAPKPSPWSDEQEVNGAEAAADTGQSR